MLPMEGKPYCTNKLGKVDRQCNSDQISVTLKYRYLQCDSTTITKVGSNKRVQNWCKETIAKMEEKLGTNKWSLIAIATDIPC